jgi:hypothetical protein
VPHVRVEPEIPEIFRKFLGSVEYLVEDRPEIDIHIVSLHIFPPVWQGGPFRFQESPILGRPPYGAAAALPRERGTPFGRFKFPEQPKLYFKYKGIRGIRQAKTATNE